MTDLEKYKAVNKCRTFEQLAEVIRSFADDNGNIQGRKRTFDAEQMAINCLNFQYSSPNLLTREFGIRQQAMYISYYTD